MLHHQRAAAAFCGGALAVRSMHCLPSAVAEKRDFEFDEEQLSRRWQAITATCNRLPSLVAKIVKEIAPKIESRGPPVRIQAEEDKRHRAIYRTIQDSEQKLQYFAARQIACRLISADGYLCDECWLPSEEDCICDKIKTIHGSLWRGVKLWLYMHPKDFLRKNNTGKLLWQSLGSPSVRLCIFGLEEQEDCMWHALEKTGQEHVWCLYPERSEVDYQVDELRIPEDFVTEANKLSAEEDACALHFILLDGTWTNSKAMLSRINLRANKAWGVDEVRCVALAPGLPSAMHDLRPQPSMEKTCTAAAASQLLQELHLRPQLAGVELAKSAEVIDRSIECLFDALASRRKRGGKPVNRIPYSTSPQLAR